MDRRILLRGARQLLTLHGPPGPRRGATMRNLAIIPDGALLIVNGVIQDVGPSRRVENLASAREAVEISADGKLVMPGFVDAHAHLVCGPPLLDDYDQRRPPSPDSTAKSLQLFSTQRMEMEARKTLRQFVRNGTTTLESKTGIGVDQRTELKILRVIDKLRELPLSLVATSLGASTGLAGSPDGLGALTTELLPAINKRRLADFIEARCGESALSAPQASAYLTAARELGFALKVLCDTPEGVALAVRLGAVSAGCLDGIGDNEIRMLADSDTVATLLPGAVFHRGSHSYPPARALIDAGAAVAIASGFSPQFSPSCSLPAALSIACSQMAVTAAEAITAATINSAHAVGRADRAGSLEAGKDADLIMLNVSDYREIPYHFGMNLVALCMKRGDALFPRMEFPWSRGL
ncbi:MAG: amidohydrolase family protein [bacterium]|nr:amidohydrolase family protein [bacterium]